jgi:uncharacterized protein
MTELTIASALLIGLLGSTHCLSMCGGLGAVLGVNTHNPNYARLLSYNLGRLCTYAAIGALAGWLGEQLLVFKAETGLLLRTLAGLLLIAMGLYISQWWMGLTRLEQLGAYCWRYIQPVSKRVLPINNHRRAWQLGVLWGLLPCGLVYSTLTWALATAQWQQSAMLMLAFGLGTLPAMLFVGVVNQRLLQQLKGKTFRTVAGVIVITMGVVTAVMPWMHSSGHQHAPSVGSSMDHQHHELSIP